MEKEKIRNIRVKKSMIKLVGTIVLVDSLVIGTVALGGHIPIHQDDKKIYQVFETQTKEWDTGHELTVSNYYQNEVDTRNRVVYYKKPYEKDGNLFREVVTVYHESFGPVKEIKTIPVEKDDLDKSYVETYEYNIDTDRFITVRETLHDELLSDTTLLLMLGLIDTSMLCVGKSYIKRREEELDSNK